MEALTSGALARVVLYCLAGLNLLTFCAYGVDKAKAKKSAWRVPESTLLLLAFFGGSFGALLGMQIFRHKTKHWYFRFGVPLMLLGHLVLGIYLYRLLRL